MSQDMIEDEDIKPRKPRKEKKPPKKITERYLYNSGLAYLHKFTSSVPNFRRVMARKIDKSCNYHKDQEKAPCLALLDATVETFVRQGLLNDEAYLRGMTTSLRRRGLSAQAIFAKLQMKGLSREAITATLAEIDEAAGTAQNPDLSAAVLMAKRKKLGCFGPRLPEKKNKELAALARAGFGFDIAQKALSMEEDEALEIMHTIRL